MAINKVVDRNGSALIDLTSDTVSPNKVLAGTKFHGADGKANVGQVLLNDLDSLKYNFIDYDGTFMYSFTDDEIDAMTELPAGPNHTDDNLTFQGWNWTLEELKAFNRARIDRPIVGANLITTDGKTYITTELLSDDLEVTINLCTQDTSSAGRAAVEIDWGDGSPIETKTITTQYYSSSIKHSYASIGEYTIVINPTANASNLILGDYASGSLIDTRVTKIQIGNAGYLNYSAKNGGYSGGYDSGTFLRSINIPENIQVYRLWSISGAKAIIIPRGTPNLYVDSTHNSYALRGCLRLETLSFPGNFSKVGGDVFDGHYYQLKNIVYPDSFSGDVVYPAGIEKLVITPTMIVRNAFLYLRDLKAVQIMEGVTTLPSRFFSDCGALDSVVFPSTLTAIPSDCFESTKMSYIKIPESVTSIGSSAFYYCRGVVLDLSERVTVPTAGSSFLPSSSDFSGKILVPAGLINEFKAASNWSSYASKMVAV